MVSFRRNTVLILLTLFFLSSLFVLSGCSKGEKEPSLREIWEKSEKGVDVKSFTMRLSIHYLNTSFGSGIVQESTIDVNGEDIHIQNSLFGVEFQELIRVGNKQYRKVFNEKKWKEEPVSVNASDVTEIGGRLTELPELAYSSQVEGKEKMGGEEVYHLVFEVSPEQVTRIFPSVPSVNLSGNQGGRIDIWVRTSDFMRIKYEALVKGVTITEKLGKGDVRIVVELTNVNQPVAIKPPS